MQNHTFLISNDTVSRYQVTATDKSSSKALWIVNEAFEVALVSISRPVRAGVQLGGASANRHCCATTAATWFTSATITTSAASTETVALEPEYLEPQRAWHPLFQCHKMHSVAGDEAVTKNRRELPSQDNGVQKQSEP